MENHLFSKLEKSRKHQKLSISALCRDLGTGNVNYYRWKKNGINGPYKKIVEDYLEKKNLGKSLTSFESSSIAVIGMGCYYPGASNIKELWEIILARRVQFRRMLDQRLPLSEYYDPDPKAPEKTYLTKAALLENFEFDWKKLRLPKSTVDSTDIAHWLALDIALKTFEDGGYKLSEIPLQNTGVIVGNTLTGEQTRSQTLRLRWPYVQKVFNTTAVHLGMGVEERSRFAKDMEKIFKSAFYPVTEDSLSGGLANTIAGRICNYLNLKGGGYIVDGACSSSLLAVATACDALKMGNMNLVLAGGVDISLDPFELVGFAKAGALAKDKMSVYDQSANGFLPGEGCGFVLLKRLEDAVKDKNYIYSVIRGWGISSDGKGGIMEPSSSGQSFAIGRAYKNLKYKIADVDFVEGHGTGTTKGDRVELEGIATAIEQSISKKNKNTRICGVTSFKSIVGHTKAAAGVGGLIKAILAVNQRILPPTASCINPNNVFKDKAKNMYPLIHGRILSPTKIARAGISSAGFGGINCHVTVESYDAPKEELKSKIDGQALFVSQQQTEVFVFTSRSVIYLKRIIQRFKEDLRNISIAEMADLAALLNKKAKPRLPIKVAIVTDSPEHLYDAIVLIEKEISSLPAEEGQIHKIKTKDSNTHIVISNRAKKARVGFIYPGQGSQRLNMSRVLVQRHKWAQDDVNLSKLSLFEHIYKATDMSLREEEIQEFERQLSDTRIAQPAIVTSSLIWTEFLSKLGIEPDCVGGHSLGELAAFYKAGAFNKEILIKFSELRGSLMAAKGSAGGMVSLFCSRQKAEELVSKVSGNIIVANINSPNQIVVSGGNKEIDKTIELARKEDIAAYRLNVSNAFHTVFMQSASEKIRFTKILPDNFKPNNTKIFSGMNDMEIDGKVNVKEYFSKQMISQVDFIGLVEKISKECDLLIEVGPGKVLTDLIKAINREHGPSCFPVESIAQSDRDFNIVLAELFAHNVPVKWEELYKNRLIKVFVPASKKKFIKNQCEHPLKIGNQIIKSESLQLASRIIEESEHNEEIIPGGLPATLNAKDNIVDLLIDLTYQITGFDKESITMNSKLLDDLNLDSIKAGEVIGKAVRTLGVAGQLDPSKLSNNTLGEIRDRLSELVLKAKAGKHEESISDILRRYHDKTWVRNFVLGLNEEEIRTKNVNQLMALKNIVILSEENDPLIDVMSKEFKNSKSKTHKISYGEKNKEVNQVDCLVAVLPRTSKTGDFNKDSLKEIIRKSHKIVDIAYSNRMNKDAFVVVVQFGGGNFGENKNLKNIASTSAKALLSTLYLERPDLRVRIIDFDNQVTVNEITERVVDELQTYERFNAIGYDSSLTRKVVYYENSNTINYKKRNIVWSAKDVVLVTGGGKGITAQCALEFARETKACMVLLGRSEVPKKGETSEITETLKQFEKEHLKASYYQCDVTDEMNVASIIKEIENKLGKITGFIHGAGLNSLKRLKQVSINEAFEESLPKVIGAVNVCKVLSNAPPKLIMGITSIIGVTGMEGSGWYGLSNEILNLYLHQFRNKHPETEIATVAYSVWDEVGMGAKLGSVERLAEKGIGAIPVEEGVKRFRQLVKGDPGVQQVIVTARLAGLDTWNNSVLKTNHFRFIEKVEYFIPGVELIAQARLNVADDPYLLDHNWKGALLFPFVFGFEAMTQAVAYVLGVNKFEHITAKNIDLQRPISVPEEDGTTIEIHAVVQERMTNDDPLYVKVKVYSQESVYKEPHFSAIFEISTKPVSLIKLNLANKVRSPIDLDIKTDIYGPILFQGKLFQSIEEIYELYYKDELNLGGCIFKSIYNKVTKSFLTKNKKFNNHFLTGDPFFVDTLLQSTQLVITPHMSLPNYIEEISLSYVKTTQSTELIAQSIVKKVDDKLFSGSIVVQGADNFTVSIKDCKLKVLEYFSDRSSANDLVFSTVRDQKIIEEKVQKLSKDFHIITPAIKTLSNEILKIGNKTARRKIEAPLIKETIETYLGHEKELKQFDQLKVEWLASGKPIINNSKLDISLSHDNDVLICVAGHGVQGCDIETITERTEKEWCSLFGNEKYDLLKEIINKTDYDLNNFGTSLWSVFETLKKATGKEFSKLELINQDTEVLIFTSSALSLDSVVAVFLVQLTKGKKRVISIIGKRDLSKLSKEDNEVKVGDFIFDRSRFKLDIKNDESKKQKLYTKRFPVTFKHTQNLGKSVYFSNYFDWMGDIREFCLSPIIQNIKRLLETGKLGMATNSAKVKILGQLESDDVVEARFWLNKISGKDDAVFDFMFEWLRVTQNGSLERVAFSEQRISWIKITGHGEGELVRPPQIFRDFMDTLQPGKNFNNISLELTDSYKNLTVGSEVPTLLKNKSLLKESRIETTLVESNLVGNIYFANYSKWLGKTRDSYFHHLFPEHFQGIGEAGEFLCLNCEINHLGEAMPFDVVLVRMYLDKVYQNGIDFNFEFLKESKDGNHRKLAFARHRVLWVKKFNGQLLSEAIPKKFTNTLIK